MLPILDCWRLSEAEVALVLAHARASAIGGASVIRHDRAVRERELIEDNVSGMLGELALAIRIYGRERGPEVFARIRSGRDATPFAGDGGCDLPGLDVDVKCVCVLTTLERLLPKVHLAVTPRPPATAPKPDRAYVLALRSRDCRTVWLVGWCFGRALAPVPPGSRLVGAFVRPAAELAPTWTLAEALHPYQLPGAAA